MTAPIDRIAAAVVALGLIGAPALLRAQISAPGAPMALVPPAPFGSAAPPAPGPTAVAPLPPPPGIGAAFWQDMPALVGDRLLPALPPTPSSPALRRLEIRLVTEPGLPASPGFRLRLLAGLGALAEAEAAAGPEALADPGAAEAWAQALLLAGRFDSACGPGGGDSDFRVGLAVFCALRDGDTASVTLHLDMLRERHHEDPGVFALAEALSGGNRPDPARFADPSPLVLALLRQARLPLPDSLAGLADPARLAAVAEDPAADPILRAAAAERAAAAGRLGASALAAAYADPSFSPDVLAAAAASTPTRADPPESARRRAALYQAAGAQSAPPARAAGVARLVAAMPPPWLAGPPGEAVAVLVPPPATAATADADTAAALATLLFAQGRGSDGLAWAETAQRLDPVAAARVWPLGVLAALHPASAGAVQAWAEIAAAKIGRAWTGTALSLLAATGSAVPPEAWRAALDPDFGPPAPGTPPALAAVMADADTAGRRGEAALAALVVLDRGGPAAAPAALRALIQAGFDREARAVARTLLLADSAGGPS